MAKRWWRRTAPEAGDPRESARSDGGRRSGQRSGAWWPPSIRAAPGPGTAQRARSGQALLELAMVAVILVVLAGGAFEFGRAFHAALKITHAARDGARVGSDPAATDAQIEAAVAASAQPLGGVAVSIARASGEVAVTATYSFTSPFPFVSEFWGGGALAIAQTAVARVDSS